AYTTSEDTPLTIGAGLGLLANDTDVDGDSLSAVLVSGPSHGALSLSSDGAFTYTPTANYHRSDSFTYRANDGAADSGIVTVSLTITAANAARGAAADGYTTGEDAPLTIGAGLGLLANDTDIDGDGLTAVLVSGPSHGALSLSSNGSF